MIKKILKLLERIFGKKTNKKVLEEGTEIKYSKKVEEQGFKKQIKFDDGKEGEALIKEILAGKKVDDNFEETKEKLLLYIDSLMKKVDQCQNDIAICKANLRNIKK